MSLTDVEIAAKELLKDYLAKYNLSNENSLSIETMYKIKHFIETVVKVNLDTGMITLNIDGKPVQLVVRNTKDKL